MIRYFKNFILCGDIDYVCLLCEESFETAEDVEKHIRWEKHRKLIKTEEYFGKLKKDCVYKVGNKYYCEICNYIARKLDIIKQHVKEESHKLKKAKPEDENRDPIVKRELGFIKVPKYTLNKKEWHGILNKQCLLCDIDDIIDFDAHIALPDHLINFIQTKVKVTDDGETYRKINAETFYCFKCKKIYPQGDMEAHWNDEEHNRTGKEVPGFRPNEMFQVDREHNLVSCTVCQQTMEWVYLQMYDHRTAHIMNKEWPNTDPNKEYAFILVKFQDKGKIRSDLKKYGKDNFIKLNQGGSKGFCFLCNSYISAHMSNFRQHVQGLRHISHLELKGLLKKTRKTEKPHYRTKPFPAFYKEHVLHIKSENVYIINDDLCIDMMSFALMHRLHHNKKIVCFVCDGIFTEQEHMGSESHKEKLLKTEIITTLKEEFVREVRPGLYHCGICNMIFAGYAVLEKHLNTIKHKLAKVEAKKMIQNCIMENVDNCFCPSNIRSHFLDFLDGQLDVS